MRKKKRLIAASVVLLAGIGVLVFVLVHNSLNYYITVGQLKADGSSAYGENLRVAGNVVADSIDWNASSLQLKFNISDDSGSLPVLYHGSMPQDFTAGKQVVVEGKYESDLVFHATSIVQKCPSKYRSD